MSKACTSLAVAAILIWFGAARGGEEPAKPAAFTAKPAARADGDGVRISFAVDRPTDVTVEIVDAGGKVVRHLAAGLLGPLAPEPLEKDKLTQSLVWDRRDDDGRPVAGGCAARVGLGLTVSLDRILENDPRAQTAIRAIAAAPGGELYMLQGIHDGNRWTPTSVLALDAKGAFARQLYPPPAGALGAASPGLDTYQRADGTLVPVSRSRWHGFLPELSGSHPTAMAVGPDGIAWVAAGGTDNPRLARLGRSGEVAKDWLGAQLPKGSAGPGRMAIVPDGKLLYICGPAGLLRVEAFAGGKPEPFAADAKLGALSGVAVDAQGNVYAAEKAGGRIAVLSPAGALLRELKVPAPEFVQAAPDGKAVYTLSGGKLVKLSADGARAAEAELPLRFTNGAGKKGAIPAAPVGLALASSGGKIVLWVAGNKPCDYYSLSYGLLRIEDGGAAFAQPEIHDLSAAGLYLNRYLGVDWAKETVFGGSGGNITQGSMTDAWDGRSGKRLASAPVFDTGPGGTLRRPVSGPKRDARGYEYRLAAMEGDPNRAKLDSRGVMIWWIGTARFKDGKPAPYEATGKNTLESSAGAAARNPNFNKEVLVRPSGDVYVMNEYPEPQAIAFGGEGFGPQTRIDHFSPEGKLVGSVTGLTSGSRTVCADRRGNIYVSDRFFPWGVTYPAEMEKQAKGDMFADYGCIVKFPPQGGRIEYEKRSWAKPNLPNGSRPAAGDPDRIVLEKGQTVYVGNMHGASGYYPAKAAEPPLWVHLGLAPVPMTGPCICSGLAFNLDEHGRIWAPDYIRCLVLVLDPNGNEIARFGSYGNLDSPTSGRDIPLVRPDDIAVSTDSRAAYLMDAQLARVLRLKTGHRAEETCPIP